MRYIHAILAFGLPGQCSLLTSEEAFCIYLVTVCRVQVYPPSVKNHTVEPWTHRLQKPQRCADPLSTTRTTKSCEITLAAAFTRASKAPVSAKSSGRIADCRGGGATHTYTHTHTHTHTNTHKHTHAHTHTHTRTDTGGRGGGGHACMHRHTHTQIRKTHQQQ